MEIWRGLYYGGNMYIPYPSPYPTEKVGNYPYPYPYPVNAGILRQNGGGFEQYPRKQIYLSSLEPTKLYGLDFCGPTDSIPQFVSYYFMGRRAKPTLLRLPTQKCQCHPKGYKHNPKKNVVENLVITYLLA